MPSTSDLRRYAEFPTVGEYPEFERTLPLICKTCGKQGKYAVGRVFVDPYVMRKSSVPDEATFDEAVSYSGIFLCKHCGADGPWQLPTTTRIALLAILTLPSTKPGELGVQFGQLRLFDGTISRTGAGSEAYLKQKLKEQPDNAYIWCRLGNFYSHSGLVDLAKEAYETSVQWDPRDPESQYQLGNVLRGKGDRHGAAKCFEAAVLHARTAANSSPKLLKDLVNSALQNLFELHDETDGEIRFPPPFARPIVAADEGPAVIGLMDVDLSSDEGWDILTSIYLTGKVPEPIRQRAARGKTGRGNSKSPRLESSASKLSSSKQDRGMHLEAKRPGRNDACPCGSGKKYKRCCLPR